MKRWIKILIGVFIIVAIGFGYWMYRTSKIEKLMELENQKAKFNTVFYMEELPIPFYEDEESEIEKIYNSLITAPIIKVKEDNKVADFVDIDNNLVIEKEFTNYKDINSVANETTALPPEKTIKYLEEENGYSKLLQEDNKAQILSLLLNLAVEEKYLEFQKWFEKRGLTDEEILIMQTSMPTDITIIGLDKIAILNNFSVLKGQEILKTIVEYLNYEFFKDAKENYSDMSSDDEIIMTVKELLGVAKLQLTEKQDNNLREKLPILRNKVRSYYKEHPEMLELPSEKEIQEVTEKIELQEKEAQKSLEKEGKGE
jgi:hypothetical protein